MDARRFLTTGGSQGIGAALVERARGAGHQVVFTGRDANRLEETAKATGALDVGAMRDMFDVNVFGLVDITNRLVASWRCSRTIRGRNADGRLVTGPSIT